MRTFLSDALAISDSIRSIRIYPHQQNTGGFFVAVLVKAATASSDDKISAPAVEEVVARPEDFGEDKSLAEEAKP